MRVGGFVFRNIGQFQIQTFPVRHRPTSARAGAGWRVHIRTEASVGDEELLRFDDVVKLIFAACHERAPSKDKAIKCNTKGPYIDGLRDLRAGFGNVAVAELRCKEGRCSDGLGQLDISLIESDVSFLVNTLAEIANTKVGNLNSMVSVPKEVGGLDIPVNDALVVKIFQAKNSVPKNLSGLLDGQRRNIHEIRIVRVTGVGSDRR